MKGRKLLLRRNLLKEKTNDEILSTSVILKDLNKIEFSVNKY